MFLSQIDERQYVNIEDVQWLSINHRVLFTMRGDIESTYEVDEEFKASFLCHLDSINASRAKRLEDRYKDIKAGQEGAKQ